MSSLLESLETACHLLFVPRQSSRKVRELEAQELQELELAAKARRRAAMVKDMELAVTIFGADCEPSKLIPPAAQDIDCRAQLANMLQFAKDIGIVPGFPMREV